MSHEFKKIAHALDLGIDHALAGIGIIEGDQIMIFIIDNGIGIGGVDPRIKERLILIIGDAMRIEVGNWRFWRRHAIYGHAHSNTPEYKYFFDAIPSVPVP